MSTREEQRVGYWLTPADCLASGGHATSGGGYTCTVCGSTVPESPADMLERAQERMARGCDPRRLVSVAIAHRDKWARLVEEWDSHGDRAAALMDGRASIYSGETYVEARDRWEAYRLLLVEELRGPGGLA